jgi:hypothetical protein
MRLGNQFAIVFLIVQNELEFVHALWRKKRWQVIKMREDGACLFRSVGNGSPIRVFTTAYHVYGDQEMHGQVRRLCMDYMVSNVCNIIYDHRRGTETILKDSLRKTLQHTLSASDMIVSTATTWRFKQCRRCSVAALKSIITAMARAFVLSSNSQSPSTFFRPTATPRRPCGCCTTATITTPSSIRAAHRSVSASASRIFGPG